MTDSNSANTIKLKGDKVVKTDKRDVLVAQEVAAQELWQQDEMFKMRAPTLSEAPFPQPISEIHEKHPKFFANFAFPYMNGSLHAGHSFTMSKVEFSTGYARMKGKRALFALGFHCTGMPIKACADKLRDEIKKFGQDFEGYEAEVASQPMENGNLPAPTQGVKKDDLSKFSGSKSKAAAKSIQAKYQFQIMLSIGIPRTEIHKFADANYWLQFFPPLCQKDLNSFGARIDWTRKFVTTDANPYFDSFVRWQMVRLKNKGKILYGSRYTIYSPKDGQPCMDHDRTSGEGVKPTEYTALKLQVKEWSEPARKIVGEKIPNNAKVYFIPATLRPETMYGQVCCFVGPKIKYGIFQTTESEYVVCTKRAAWNMAFQGHFFDSDHFPRNQSELQPVVEAEGTTFVGTLVNAPLSEHKSGVRILPMESVSEKKGTGVVTSVPSDSPDDYATMKDLAKKASYYGIEKEWAELDIIPIIRVPQDDSEVDLIAKYLVEKLKINSPKDVVQLAEAKDLAYKVGFYQGTMLIGDFKGEKVEEAKPKVRKALIDSGDAFPFADPAETVISRSGDDCVVAYLGQWFLNYGENDPEWRGEVLSYIHAGNTRDDRQTSIFDDKKPHHGLQTYLEETASAFEKNIEWLNQWACARTYGLGSKLPWDKSFLVESLSDSTIYMAYYTIAHLLHGDEFGRTAGELDIKPEQMTDEVWDYVMGLTKASEAAATAKAVGLKELDLQTMRREFEYWYPLDMRVSGKDLILNHLTFFLYIHIALFPKEHWPRSIRANGHLMLNGEKMSKSTGNFLTLSQAIQKFGADPTRIALADAGDGIDDANLDEETANGTILKLFTLKEWIEESLKEEGLRKGSAETIWDKLFSDEMNMLVHETEQHYEATNFKLALKSGFYDFQAARDFYRSGCDAIGIKMSYDLLIKYVRLQALMITVTAPHWAEYMWRTVLGEEGSVQDLGRWPKVPLVQKDVAAQREYIRATSTNITSAQGQAAKKKAKGKATGFDPKKPKRITIYVAENFPAWQSEWVDLLREEHISDGSSTVVQDKLKAIRDGRERTKIQAFVQVLKNSLRGGADADEVFQRKLLFDEVELLHEMKMGLLRTTGSEELVVIKVDDEKTNRAELPPAAESAVPGRPAFVWENI